MNLSLPQKISILFLCLFGYPLFGQTPQSAKIEVLENVYKSHSISELNSFFSSWHKEIPPLSSHEINELPSLQKEAYNAFKAFYNSPASDDRYKYIILQNKLKIYQANRIALTQEDTSMMIQKVISNHKIDTFQKGHSILIHKKNGLLKLNLAGEDMYPNIFRAKDSLVDSLNNFRPEINGKKTPLYLTADHEKMLNTFLGNKYMAKNDRESQKRMQFLENFIKISTGYWSQDWRLNSGPNIYSICFDKSMTRAKIEFSYNGEGGETVLKKKDGKWVVVSAKNTWVE